MKQSIPDLIKQMIKQLGENPNREGLKETPKRMERMYHELLKGYKINPKSIFKRFDGEKYTGLIVVSDIDFYSLCEHHMLPFYGKVHIGYIPDGHILGLSKFARLVEIFARRLQVQERMTKQIADTLQANMNPKGVAVYCEAQHLCMSMRGIKKTNCCAKTLITSGLLKTNKNLLGQFFNQINSDLPKKKL